MSIITKIEQQKNKQRVNIYVDEAFFCGLNKETAIIFGLKVGKDVSEEQLKEAITNSEIKSAFDKATDYIGARMHTKSELLNKLIKKGYTKEVATMAISKLEEYGYVDDNEFARLFILENAKLSRRMLENKLRQKGIDLNIIEEQLGARNDQTELESCKNFAKKYAKGKDLSIKENVQKLYASLSRRGFDFETIKKACKELVSEDETADFMDV